MAIKKLPMTLTLGEPRYITSVSCKDWLKNDSSALYDSCAGLLVKKLIIKKHLLQNNIKKTIMETIKRFIFTTNIIISHW